MVRAWHGGWSVGTSNTSRPLLSKPLLSAGEPLVQPGLIKAPGPGLIEGGGVGIREVGRMCRSLDTSEDRVTSPPRKNSLSWGLSSVEMCTMKRTKSSAPFRGFLITEALNRQTPVRGEGRDPGEAGNSWRKRKRLGGGCRPGLQAACGSC